MFSGLIATKVALYYNYSSCSNDDKTIVRQSPNVLALYLTSKSKNFLKERLAKIGYDDYTADYVVIKRLSEKTKDNNIKNYKQYYGDKAAFRLKGIIKTESGLVVVTFSSLF
jgi:hypothetical protein